MHLVVSLVPALRVLLSTFVLSQVELEDISWDDDSALSRTEWSF